MESDSVPVTMVVHGEKVKIGNAFIHDNEVEVHINPEFEKLLSVNQVNAYSIYQPPVINHLKGESK